MLIRAFTVMAAADGQQALSLGAQISALIYNHGTTI